jgi:hypothetical protein
MGETKPFNSSKKDIYETVNAVMAEIGAIGKNSKNAQQGFMFRGIDAVMNALAPALQKHKLFIVPEILDQRREERQTKSGNNLIYSVCTIRYTFYAEDGSHIEATVIGEGMDSGDKATNKAMSIAFKYACFQVFCIPTEEMIDPDAECHEVAPKKKEEPKKITKRQAELLDKRCVEEGVQQQVIIDLYKVKSLADLNEIQYDNICQHWDKIKEKSQQKEEVTI